MLIAPIAMNSSPLSGPSETPKDAAQSAFSIVPWLSGAALVLALWWWLPHFLIADAKLAPNARLVLENSLRDTLAHALEAALIAWGATSVWRYLQGLGTVVAQSSQTLAAAERTAFFAAQAGETQRYARAMELLSSAQLEVRLGGVYALERLARESQRDHGPIMEVLAATLRDRAAWIEGEVLPARLGADLQAIATVIGRRQAGFDPSESHIDLHATGLARAYLPGANLAGAFLYETNLQGAILQGADLRGARLWKADLSEATLDGAQLQGADLTGVAGLVATQLANAHFDETTKLPQHLRGATGAQPKNGAAPDVVKPIEASAEDLKLPSVRS